MSQFFVKPENIEDNRILITNKSDIKHISNILRLKTGEIIYISDENKFIYETAISSINKDFIEVKIIQKQESNKKLKINITLAQSILKGQKQDIVIQKATELGVKKIIPFISQNTVVKINSDKDGILKAQRWQKIADEAAKQCERVDLLQVMPISTINKVISLSQYDLKITCLERETGTIREFLKKMPHANNILLITGPEGGFDKKEAELFIQHNIPTVSLGNLILRAETAVITAIANVIYEYEL